MTVQAQRVTLPELPYLDWRPDDTAAPPWQPPPQWPCSWIGPAQPPTTPSVFAFRRRFTLASAMTVRCHVTADERYLLFVDGAAIGRGSERGDPQHWFYETYDIQLTAGEHVIVAQVWALGKLAPWAQMTVTTGFLLSPEGDDAVALLGTGVAPWEIAPLPGYDVVSAQHQTGSDMGSGAGFIIDGRAFAWDFAHGGGAGWQPATTLAPGNNGFALFALISRHLLAPATLPAMRDAVIATLRVRFVDASPEVDWRTPPVALADDLTGEHASWEQCLTVGEPLTVPAHTRRRVIIDLQDYRCLYPELEISGGVDARITLLWAEALFTHPQAQSHEKGQRDVIDGGSFIGTGDAFIADGGEARRFTPLWWRVGRYAQVTVQTGDTPLTIERLTLRKTGFPLAVVSQIHLPDPSLAQLLVLCERTLRRCMHETYMDCPYYEQLMYIGDTRIQCLLTYVLSTDDRLPRKALQMFDASRLNYTALPLGAHPSQQGGIIAPFALWWVGMVHDFALWRGDPPFIRTLLPGVRAVLQRFVGDQDASGLVISPPGWNFYDQAWGDGMPPGGKVGGVSSTINWHVILALHDMATLESWAGEPEFARWAQRQATELAARATTIFWDESRQLLADDREHQQFSEHTQCLALLGGRLPPEQQAAITAQLRAGPAPDLCQASGYFTHYVFETYQQLGLGHLLPARLTPWLALAEQGFLTCPETLGATRSDCHAWNAHPLYHAYATMVGILPATLGFTSVAITPQLGALPAAEAVMYHTHGAIAVRFASDAAGLTGTVTLPPGITGTLHYATQTIPLHPGTQTIAMRREEFEKTDNHDDSSI